MADFIREDGCNLILPKTKLTLEMFAADYISFYCLLSNLETIVVLFIAPVSVRMLVVQSLGRV